MEDPTVQRLLGDIVARIERMEAKIDERLHDTRPMFEYLKSEIVSLREGQDQLREGQDQLRTGQDQLRAGQDQLRTGQDQLRAGQDQLRTGQDQLRTGQDQLRKDVEALKHAVQVLNERQDRVEINLKDIDRTLRRFQLDILRQQDDFDERILNLESRLPPAPPK